MRRSSELLPALGLAAVTLAAAVFAHGRASASVPSQPTTPSPTRDGSVTQWAITVTPSPTVYGAQTLTAEHRASATRTGTATATPTARPTTEPGTCLAITEKLAAEQAYLGDTIGITLTVRALCAGMRFPTHVVLVMDGSEAMAGQPGHDMIGGALKLVRDLQLEHYPSTNVAVVDSGEHTRRLCDLTNDEARVLRCLRRVGATGTTSLSKGLLEGLRVVRQGRRDLHPYQDATEIVIVFSQGCDDKCCDEAVQGARTLRNDGVLMMSVCVGRSCDDQCVRQLAAAPRYFYQVRDLNDLVDVFDQIRGQDYFINIRRLTVTDRLPTNMRYVPGSAMPEPASVSPGGNVLVWEDVYVPREGVTYTLEVEPSELGQHTTNLDAQVELMSNTGWKGTFPFPVPTVWVRVRPTPTASMVPSATPSTTASPTPSPVNSPTPSIQCGPLWLPAVGWRETP